MQDLRINDDGEYGKSYFIRGEVIPSRYFLAPINTGFCRDGDPCRGLLRFHSDRSGKGIGVSYVGNVAIDRQWAVTSSTGCLRNREAWARLASAIAKKQSAPGIQLACKLTKTPTSVKWNNSNHQEHVAREREEISGVSDSLISSVVNQFAECARVAEECQFKVIQIHAAHGYFISQLLSPSINQRGDKYGKDRDLALLQIVELIRKMRIDAIVDVRLSLSLGLEAPQIERERLVGVVRRLVDAGVDMISISNGLYNVNRFDIYPRKSHGHACYLDDALQLASLGSSVLWNVAGNVWDLSLIETKLPPNVTVSIGRALIANPHFIEDFKRKAASAANCERCGHCHFYSRGKPHILCGVNPSIGDADDSMEPI